MKNTTNWISIALLGGSLVACGGGSDGAVDINAKAAADATCSEWSATATYPGKGFCVIHLGKKYTSNWYTQNNEPNDAPWGPWTLDASAPTSPQPPAPTPDPAPIAAPTPVACRPDGLASPVVNVPYCQVYDANGREKLAHGLNRRIVGYFTSWRTGTDGAPTYLVNNVPWDKITHLNYAFASVDKATYRLALGTGASNPDTGLTWPTVPGASMDASLPYNGHFNLLAQYKRKYPDVKILLSVGGWAGSSGFYTATTQADGSTNTAGIDTLADSMVAFLRQYPFFDGIDIDYEHPTSDNEAGNPDDFSLSKPRLSGLMAGYNLLLKTVRAKLDAAAVADQKYYLLSIAGSASAWVLRGEENQSALKVLDYASLMSYDLHGGWNKYVGPNAPLFDDGNDAELKAGSGYQYGNIGYLNVDWAYRYYRGALQAGRINLGVPFYTRGWKDVSGGNNGLWGTSPEVTSAITCAGVAKCGSGAVGIDNVWYDMGTDGKPVPGGGNPLWHALNLQQAIVPDYLDAYKVTDKSLVGTYSAQYSAAMAAPWLWNDAKKVFLSTETAQSIDAKTRYIADNAIGGIMIWELAGDYAWNATRNSGKGEYFMGNTLTSNIYTALKAAGPYGNRRAEGTLPATSAKVDIALGGWKPGDASYPLNPVMTVTNNSTTTIPGGSKIEFDYPVSAPADMSDQSGYGLSVKAGDASTSNVGGFKVNFHHAQLTIPAWQALVPGGSVAVTLNYRLPISGPLTYVITIGGVRYALATEYPELPVGLK
ncbi:MAG: chitinase [Rhodoferax sp.]|nr:chitinase [Rhodoferax sp.]